MAKKGDFRSECPVSCALDVIGDKWTLIIIRDMLIFGKNTFKALAESDEKIATNILSSRLKLLAEHNIITKHKLPNNKKTNIYELTDAGINLFPLIAELILWSDDHVRKINPEIANHGLGTLRKNKMKVIENIQNNYRKNMTSTLYKQH